MKSVYLRDDLHQQLKLIAGELRQPLVQVVEYLLQVGLRNYQQQRIVRERMQQLLDGLFSKADELAMLDYDFSPEDQEEFAAIALGLAPAIPAMVE